MSQSADRPPLSRPLRVDEIAVDASGRIDASQDEMAAIAALLDLQGLDGLALAYRLRHGGGGRVLLTGRVTALVTQTCVVSLEPVRSAIDVPIEVEFWENSAIAGLEARVEEPGRTGLWDWPEPILDGTIDIGPVVYETLATALDPYPKQEGVSFEWSQEEDSGGSRDSGPFAALGQLKRR